MFWGRQSWQGLSSALAHQPKVVLVQTHNFEACLDEHASCNLRAPFSLVIKVLPFQEQPMLLARCGVP